MERKNDKKILILTSKTVCPVFKTVKGRGKKKVETYHNECLDNGVAPMCATERTEDCKIKKWAYCAPDSK